MHYTNPQNFINTGEKKGTLKIFYEPSLHSSASSSVIVSNTGKMGTLVGEMRRAGATSIQELKFLISFAIVVRELLCPANKPKTQKF